MTNVWPKTFMISNCSNYRGYLLFIIFWMYLLAYQVKVWWKFIMTAKRFHPAWMRNWWVLLIFSRHRQNPFLLLASPTLSHKMPRRKREKEKFEKCFNWMESAYIWDSVIKTLWQSDFNNGSLYLVKYKGKIAWW